MVKFLFVGDLHLRGTNPRNRIDDYKEVAKQKLKEVFKIAVDNAVDAILQPGDIFDRPEVGIAVLLEFAEVLKESPVNIYCTLGNHDIYGYNVDSYYRTSLRLLEMLVPQLTVIRSASDKPIYLAKGHYKVYLTATPYSKDMDINGYGYGPDVDYPEGNHIGVHIAHGMLLARMYSGGFEMQVEPVKGHKYIWACDVAGQEEETTDVEASVGIHKRDALTFIVGDLLRDGTVVPICLYQWVGKQHSKVRDMLPKIIRYWGAIGGVCDGTGIGEPLAYHLKELFDRNNDGLVEAYKFKAAGDESKSKLGYLA